jgi:Uncharacterised nucleotidyltransferase
MHPPIEFRLFCMALRRARCLEHTAWPDVAGVERLNWAAIVEGALRHHVAALVLEGLQGTGVSVPDAVIAALRRQAERAAWRALVKGALVARFLPLLANAGIRVMMLKGLALSMQLYGDPAHRSSGDIDLLIDPAQFERARPLLAQAGLRAKVQNLSRRQQIAYHRWIKDEVMIDPVSGTSVELHHRLTDNPELLSYDFDTLWHGRVNVSVWGTTVATLPPQFLCLYLCAHGAAHAWHRLRWLIDLADALGETEVETTLAVAHSAGLGAALLHAMELAHDWLGIPVPVGFLTECRRDPAAIRLGHIHTRLYAGEAWHRLPQRHRPAALRSENYWQMRYRLSLKSGWRYGLRQVSRELVSPADWGTVALPDRLFFLYPVVRPVGWLIRRRHRLPDQCFDDPGELPGLAEEQLERIAGADTPHSGNPR